jgi:SAM-dependent methyltransferase
MLSPPLLFASFWGSRWQNDPTYRARATGAIRSLMALRATSKAAAFVQSSYYTRGGWSDGTNPTAMSPRFITAALQDAIDRKAFPDVNSNQSERPPVFFIIFLDETLSVSTPDGECDNCVRHGHFESMAGHSFYYGIVPSLPAEGRSEDFRARWLAASAETLIDAFRRNPITDGLATAQVPQEALIAAIFGGRDDDAPAENRQVAWPSVYIENRAPRFRVDDDEVNGFWDRLTAPMPIAGIPGVDKILRRGSEIVDARVIEHARGSRPASPLELQEFSKPLPRFTISERLTALKSVIGENHPDVSLVESMLTNVDQAKLLRLFREYYDDGACGFIDAVFWAYYKLQLARRLGLEGCAPKSIWDIGCGGGHFSLVCERLGHTVIGTDVKHIVFQEIASALGVVPIIDAITPDEPTTDFGGKFDVVVASQIEFDRLHPYTEPPRYFSIEQWKFLLQDLMTRQLNYPAQIHIQLNYQQRQGGVVFDLELLRLCTKHGAEVSERSGIIDWKLDQPISL